MISLLDYGAGNVRSVVNAIEHLGEQVRLVSSPEDLASAEKLVFPGVGHYGELMRVLREKGLREPLIRHLRSGRPFFGICVALQALYEGSEEAPDEAGLGLYPGRVRRFAGELPVPHIGWNGIRACKASPFLAGFDGSEKLYFVHSYHVPAAGSGPEALTLTDYGTAFVSAIADGQRIATQFHPEKSGRPGLKMLANFYAYCRETAHAQ